MRGYKPSDYPTIQYWAESRGVEIVPGEWLPSEGLINDQAVCFIVSTDTPVCFIEYLIAAKTATNDKIDEVVEGCIALAKALGFKEINALTVKSTVSLRAKKHGFSGPESVMLLKLGVDNG